MCSETSTVLRAVVADFFFNCWYFEIPSDKHIWHIPRCIHYHAQGLRLETFQNFYVGSGSRTPELYSEVQIGLSIVLYMRSMLLVESFDLHWGNQYILVRLIPSCFHFTKDVEYLGLQLAQTHVHSPILDVFFLAELHIVYMNREPRFFFM
jgi:hypothetical protein